MEKGKRQQKVIRMKTHQGSIRQKTPGGPYYYRVTIRKGLPRKEFPLKTNDPDKAKKLAADLAAVLEAQTQEVALAQINAIKGFSKQAMNLPLSEAWSKYEVHPNRATPHTVSEQLAYQSTYEEFVQFVSNPLPGKRRKHNLITSISEISPEVCEEFSDYLKTTSLAVDTHNRKIKRLRKIFDCLKEYYSIENPFRAKPLLRNEREERDTVVRRQAFTREQEQALMEALRDPKHKLINKDEIRILYTIGMFTGQRLKDCVLMQWQNIDLERRYLSVKQFKTGKEVTFPIAPELYAAFQEALVWKVDAYVCPKTAARYNQTNAAGKDVGNNLVNIDVLRVIRWIGLEPSVDVPGRDKKMTVYGFHSLRHSFASFCAAENVPKATLLSFLGTDSDIADKYYTHVGDASQRQAIAAISDTMQKVSPQEKIDKVLELLKTKPAPTEEVLVQIEKMLI